jgi:hypothetical protein
VLIALMIAFSVMSYFDRTIMSIAGPQIMKEFDLSATQMGSSMVGVVPRFCSRGSWIFISGASRFVSPPRHACPGSDLVLVCA